MSLDQFSVNDLAYILWVFNSKKSILSLILINYTNLINGNWYSLCKLITLELIFEVNKSMYHLFQTKRSIHYLRDLLLHWLSVAHNCLSHWSFLQNSHLPTIRSFSGHGRGASPERVPGPRTRSLCVQTHWGGRSLGYLGTAAKLPSGKVFHAYAGEGCSYSIVRWNVSRMIYLMVYQGVKWRFIKIWNCFFHAVWKFAISIMNKL